MQVTLEVNPEALKVEFTALMATLTDPQRVELVERVMLAWIRSSVDEERVAYQTQAEAAARMRTWSVVSSETEAWRSPREKLLAAYMKGMVSGVEAAAAKAVNTDPVLLKMWEIARDYIAERFPEIVQNAIAVWLSQRIGEMGQSGMAFSDSLSGRLNRGLVERIKGVMGT